MIVLHVELVPLGQTLMGRTNEQMASKDDQPPNSGLWGHVEVEALPNPGSLPTPPAEATPIQRGTLMGFAVPPAVAIPNAVVPEDRVPQAVLDEAPWRVNPLRLKKSS